MVDYNAVKDIAKMTLAELEQEIGADAVKRINEELERLDPDPTGRMREALLQDEVSSLRCKRHFSRCG